MPASLDDFLKHKFLNLPVQIRIARSATAGEKVGGCFTPACDPWKFSGIVYPAISQSVNRRLRTILRHTQRVA